MDFIVKEQLLPTEGNKKILVIHPKDETTDFLSVLYKNIPDEDVTIVTGGKTKEEVHDLIRVHDRIFMMGHGTEQGLWSARQFGDCSFVIDHTTVPLLKEKENNVHIWCFASSFFRRHNLKGFSTGMFISEVQEALYCGLELPSQEIVDVSNEAFTELLERYILESSQSMYDHILLDYGELAKDNPIAKYNHSRLYCQ